MSQQTHHSESEPFEILLDTVQKHASGMHLKANLPPVMRVDGKLVRSQWPLLDAEQVRTMILGIRSSEQVQSLEDRFDRYLGAL